MEEEADQGSTVSDVQSPCDCAGSERARRVPVEMSGTHVTIKFTDRETAIFKAGQCFGAAQALKQSAEALSRLTQRTAHQADSYAKEGQRAFALLEHEESKGSAAGRAFAMLVRKRISLVVNALMGREPSR